MLTRRSLFRAAAAAGAATVLGSGPAAAVERLANAGARATSVTSLVRVRCDRASIDALTSRFDVTEHVHWEGTRPPTASQGWVEVVAHPGDLARLRAQGFDYEVVVDDLVAQFTRDRLAEARHAEAAPQERTSYRTLAEYHADMDRLVTLAPALVKPFELVTPTHQGRRIRGIEIAADVERAATDGRATAFMCGLHHAREWPSGELTIMFAEDLVDRYLAGDAEIVALLGRLRLIVIPVANPDGFVRSRETVPYDATVDLAFTYAQEGPYQRKNLRSDTDLPAEPQQGVDTNRNYPYAWGGVGASASATSQTFHGPAPGSEPEVVALMGVFRSNQILAGISNHTSGNLVLRPWGYTSEPAPDEDVLAALGDAMAAHNGYRSGLWNVALYPGTGIVDDWSYGLFGTLCYTLEHGAGFHPAYGSNIPTYWSKNAPAYMEMLRAAADPALHGVLTGTAPAGTVLTLTKSASSWFSKAAPDGALDAAETYETAMVVGDDGTFTWHVNPSPTAATLLAIESGDAAPADRETYTLTATRPDGSTTTRTLLVERGGRYALTL